MGMRIMVRWYRLHRVLSRLKVRNSMIMAVLERVTFPTMEIASTQSLMAAMVFLLPQRIMLISLRLKRTTIPIMVPPFLPVEISTLPTPLSTAMVGMLKFSIAMTIVHTIICMNILSMGIVWTMADFLTEPFLILVMISTM